MNLTPLARGLTLFCLLLPSATPLVARDGKIVVPGSSVRGVATDELVMKFELKTEAASFAEARQIIDDLRGRLEALEVDGAEGPITVDYDLGTLKQQSFYWRRGSKLDHQLEMTVEGVGDQLPSTFLQIVDHALEIEPRMTLQSVESQLSDEEYERIHREVLAEAAVDARRNADTLAEASRLRVVGAVSIYAAQLPDFPASLGQGITERVMVSSYSRGRPPRRRKFSINADLSPTVDVSAAITAVFAVEATDQPSN